MIERERPRPSFVRSTWRRVHRYLGEGDATDVALIETLLAQALGDAGLAEQARTSTKEQFAASARLHGVLEDALHRHPSPSAAVLAEAQEMSGAELARLMIDSGLFERLRGEAPAG